jgi:hypothetical protein
MRSRVVRVDDLSVPRTREGADPPGGGQIPRSAHRDSRRRDPRPAQALHERGPGGGDDEWFVAAMPEGSTEEQYLPLTSPPLEAGVDVQDPRRHGRGN